jgi:hypothetical protein
VDATIAGGIPMSSDAPKLTVEDSTAPESDGTRGNSDTMRTWRRDKVWEMKSMGRTIDEIVEKLKPKEGIKISHGTVHNDLKFRQKQIEASFKNYIDKELPIQHNLAVTGLDRIINEGWKIYEKAEDQKTALAALDVISDAIMKKQAVLGDPAQIERAIKLVSSLKKRNAENEPEDDGHNSAATEDKVREESPTL